MEKSLQDEGVEVMWRNRYKKMDRTFQDVTKDTSLQTQETEATTNKIRSPKKFKFIYNVT